MKCRGEVTAFLSLIFILLLSFLLALTESASVQLEKNYRRTDVDRGIYSVFGEYHKALLEEYGVFGMDMGYQTGVYEEKAVINRLRYYGAAEMEHEIRALQLLTDNQGSAFREQVILYMKDLYGISIVEDLTGMAGQWTEQEIEGQEKLEQIQGTVLPEYPEAGQGGQPEAGSEEQPNIEGEPPHMETEEEGREEPEFSEEEKGRANEAWSAIERIKSSPLLSLIFPKENPVSDKTLLLEETTSHRTLQSGRGHFQIQADMDGITGTALFNEYLFRKFSCAATTLNNGEMQDAETTEQKETVLDYELEYILCGKAGDRENLEKTVRRLTAIRFAVNYAYLLTDVGKQSEARATAAVMSALILNPQLAEPLGQILLLIWAFGESIMDLRSLLKGGKVPLIKTSESWQLPLSGLLRMGTAEDPGDGMNLESGMDYETYLRVLLFAGNQDQTTMRCMDLVEQNLRLWEGKKVFFMDFCMAKVKLHSKAELSRGISYDFNTSYTYQ